MPARSCRPPAKRCRPRRKNCKSANEELQSTNEELQSTNEELTTSKEEMQSMNEELQTVNHELQAKVDELSRANNDMKNLLNSTDIATLFLDDELKVRRFTTQTTKHHQADPRRRRPAHHRHRLSDWIYPELADDAREVLRTLVFHERQVATRDGRWFTVRIMPYRTLGQSHRRRGDHLCRYHRGQDAGGDDARGLGGTAERNTRQTAELVAARV